MSMTNGLVEHMFYVYEYADHVKTYLTDGQYYVECHYKDLFTFKLSTSMEGAWGQTADWIRENL